MGNRLVQGVGLAVRLNGIPVVVVIAATTIAATTIAGTIISGAAIATEVAEVGAGDPLVAELSPLLAQGRNTCRKVLAEGRTAFFNSLPQPGSSAGILQQGDRVELLDGGTTYRGGDGQIYLRVAYPYDNANRRVGYIPYRYTPAGGGSRSTLGYCGVPGWW